MTVEGVDYSWDRPDPAALIAAGKFFACRYLSDEPSKNLTRAEADAGAAAGLWWVVVFEAEAGQELPDPAWAAGEAVAQARALGVPDGRPIYFAVDWDAQSGEFDAIEDFLLAYGANLGPYVAGVYGGEHVIGAMLDRGAVDWTWQTYAWSNALDPRANLYQYSNNVQLVGALVDLDRAYTQDYGQWRPGINPFPDEPEIDMASTATVLIDGNPNVFAVASDGKIYQQWPDPGKDGGWSGWSAGVPGDWAGGLSVVAMPLPQIWGVASDGKTIQTTWSSGDAWHGPVAWVGIESI